MISNKIVNEDLDKIFESIKDKSNKFDNSNIFITGCCGFLGYYFLNFFNKFKKQLNIKSIVAVDNFQVGRPDWLDDILKDGNIDIQEFDIIKGDISKLKLQKENSFVIHMASIASPVFYRKYPIETIEANIWGLKMLLDEYKNSSLKGFLFFSSSEVYGDPTPENIPTPETYRGNVSSVGPRSCYDESKRFGETICLEYSKQFNLPISIARPFNNYGPGMKIDDKRVPADFAKAVLNNQNIEILSNGSPTRTFCYISDAITGYLKILLHGKFDYFNIGIEKPEISIKELACIYVEAAKELFDYQGEVIYKTSDDQNYLTDNPNRRCPNINKAIKILDYSPKVGVHEGIKRYLEYLKTMEIK
ncbi:MAG: NAD-dependent epimerase/dehydratase family protein [Candidatus Gastranaerophilales bacterium]|nr:NAD-dependent epimerase/dehydratase family protein [Candidatus Gastranaerophilales bacterium]